MSAGRVAATDSDLAMRGIDGAKVNEPFKSVCTM